MVFYKAVIRVSVGATVMSRFSWGRICFQAHFGCWKDWFLMGSWTEGFDSLLADGQRLPSVPFQMALHQSKYERRSEERKTSEMKLGVLCNLITEVILCHFCLFRALEEITKSSLHSREGSIQGSEY